MRRIAVQNLKGGTAKTTTSVNLAHALALRGRRVLLIDADVQGNVSTCLGLGKQPVGLYQLLIDDQTAADLERLRSLVAAAERLLGQGHLEQVAAS